MHKANLKKRIISTILDYGFFFLVCFIYTNLVGTEDPEGGKTLEGLLALPVPLAWLVYFVLVESVYGSTLGHNLFDLRVLNEDRKEIGFMQALKRHILDPVDMFFYGIPAIVAIKNTAKCQRLGDLWAGTIVIDTNDPDQAGSETI